MSNYYKGRRRDYSSLKYKKLSQKIKRMPTLKHSNGIVFEWNKSEVMNWLLQQDEVKQFLWNEILNINNFLNMLYYSPANKTWTGTDRLFYR